MDGLKININKALQIKFNRENIEPTVLLTGKMFFGKQLLGKMLFGKQQLGNMFLGNMLFGKILKLCF